jgi:Tfp pilus assembly protein PilN
MINIHLNLLPPAKKSYLERLVGIFLLKDIIQLFLLVVAAMSAVLIWSWIFLEKDFASLTASAVAINRDYYAYNQDTKYVNDLLREINLATKNFTPLTPKLTDLINSLPHDIKIHSLQLDQGANTLTINGIASSRANLLSYQETLNKISWIQNLEAPVSQLFQKENIDFEFKAKLKP